MLEAKATTLRFSPDGRLLVASIQNTSRVWEVESRNLLFEIPEATALAFSPDGQFLAARAEDKIIRIWDIAQKTWQQTVPTDSRYINGLTYSPDGRNLISWEEQPAGSLLKWDTHTWKLWTPCRGRTSTWRLAIRPTTGSRIGLAKYGQGLQLWDLNTGLVDRL
jgi:WD40 repeat protein